MPALSKDKNLSRIHILPEKMANQIAAGEVVERPMSVVKELMENSIDAGATRILAEIEAGGKGLIKVTDNGIGMSPEDARLAFSRHATSKVSCPEDLEAIGSLGFRGEALPSIASVARVALTTTHDENTGGTLVAVEGGAHLTVKDCAASRGTMVEVARLFFNTPARKKFMKADGTEFSHITKVVTQQALAHPHIHFTLIHNGREVINCLPTEQLLYRIAELFNPDLAKELVRVEAEAGDYRLEGFISNPVHTRSNRSYQYFYINNRFVRDKVIFHSTQHGYNHLLPRGQHPALFLFLSMNPKLLDVNVHPAKAEVRFAFQQEVHRFVSKAVKNALTRNEQALEAAVEREGKNSPIADTVLPFRSPASSNFSEGPGKSFGEGFREKEYFAVRHEQMSKALELMYQPPAGGGPGPSPADSQVEIFGGKPAPVSRLIYSDFGPLGQLENSFIIMQGKQGVLVVDQHIAHERVLYERFREAAKNKKIEVQKLLFPLSLEFSPGEAQLLSTHLDRLKDLGLELEPFGQNGFLLRSVPAILKSADHEKLMNDIVEMLPRQEQGETLQKKYEEILIMMACRNAIKVHMPLQMDQIKKLLSDLEQTEMPYTCPHGRPIALLFEMDEILKRFLRK